MKIIKHSHDSSHFLKQNEILLFIFTFITCIIIDFFQFPVNDIIKTSESFNFKSGEKRISFMYSLKPISFFQRFLVINLVLVPKFDSFAPINITTTSHLRTPNSIYNFQLNYLLNMSQSRKLTIFKKNSLINSMLSMNLIFEGNLNEFSNYLIEITHGKEVFGKILISIRFAFFIITIIGLIFYNNIMKHHKSHRSIHHIQILLIILAICDFPHIVLFNFNANYFTSYVDNLTFLFYPAFFISYLFYLCFFINRGIKLFYCIILTLLLYLANYQMKNFLLSQLYEDNHQKSFFSIWIQIIILIFHLISTCLIRYCKKYESSSALFVFLNSITLILILFYLFSLYFERIKNVFIFEFLVIQFFNLATFELVSMFIPNTSNIVNEQLYYVEDYLFDTGSKSI